MSRPNFEALRELGPVGVLLRAGAKPSSRKGRYGPCPLCGGPDVQIGRVTWTCHRCEVSMDAVATAKHFGGGTWEGAMAWAGVDSVPDGYRVPSRPLVLDWSPVWTWDTRRQPPRFWSTGLPWGGEGPAPFEPDPHGQAWARLRQEVEPGDGLTHVRASAMTAPWRRDLGRRDPAMMAALGLEALAGRETVVEMIETILDWSVS